MNENVIEFLRDQETATLTLCQGRHIGKIRKLAEKYPDECKIIFENEDGSILAHIPVTWIKFNPPKELTDEERERLSEHMKYVRHKQLLE